MNHSFDAKNILKRTIQDGSNIFFIFLAILNSYKKTITFKI